MTHPLLSSFKVTLRNNLELPLSYILNVSKICIVYVTHYYE